jgi:large subunit ribosomal protein L21
MYAVVKTGGKQYRVEKDQVIQVELLGEIGSAVELSPVMIVDEDKVLATPDELKGARVTAEILALRRGKKINGFTYKNKSNQRRRWGHRQNYNEIRITEITKDK